ncbi:MAG: CDP-alcohol phosphatidyltransferase family protein [Chromatiales bacterium]|nr:CDP-alcohol phosphatidyltransferase family protein [Chromatiales bacterium]
MKARYIPNLICILRILLVPPVVILMLGGDFALALLLFAIAGVSDGLDGYLARRFDWRSRLGAILDPLADKLLMVSSYTTMGWLGLLPWWLVVLVLLRDVVIIGGALIYHHLCGYVEMAPTLISKANTVLQIMLVLLVMIIQAGLSLPEFVLTLFIAAVAITTLWSGINYVWEWSRRARHCSRGAQGA